MDPTADQGQKPPAPSSPETSPTLSVVSTNVGDAPLVAKTGSNKLKDIIAQVRRTGPGACLCNTWQALKGSWAFRIGVVFFILGVAMLIASDAIYKKALAYRKGKIREALVVSSKSSPYYNTWVSSNGTKTAMLNSYVFFNITNPDDFLSGQPPVLQEVGPLTFVQRSKKVNVQFSADGNTVSYVQLVQYDFQGNHSSVLDQKINIYNLAYSAAANLLGKESDMLVLGGGQQAMDEIKRQLTTYFVPALQEGGTVTAINTSVTLAETFPQPTDNAVALLWGGGCLRFPLGATLCGYAGIQKLTSLHWSHLLVSVQLMNLCMDTKIPSSDAIPVATVLRLWDATDRYAIFNTEFLNASTRYGISYWLNADAQTATTLKSHFGITDAQYNYLQTYLKGVQDSDQLQTFVIKTFHAAIGADDTKTTGITSWQDFWLRQWLVGDVIGQLKATGIAPNRKIKWESVDNANPPEFGWYLEKVAGVPTLLWGGKRFSNEQGLCILGLAKQPMKYFEKHVMGYLAGARAEFVDAGLPTMAINQDYDFDQCFPLEEDKELVRGYLRYLAKRLVAPVFKQMMEDMNGGLVTRRTLREILYGYEAPILAQALAADDPRRMSFGLLQHDKSLDGPAVCTSSADVENAYTACTFSGSAPYTYPNGTTVQRRTFEKVPNTYYTGKDNIRKMSAFKEYHGEKVVSRMWSGDFVVDGGAAKVPGSVQYGYSAGQQFPPLNAVTKPHAVLSVFVPGFVLPLYLTPVKDVWLQGVRLRRFMFASDTFSSTRRDAQLLGMDQSAQSGLLNITRILGMPAYLTKPHTRLMGAYANAFQGMSAYNATDDDSYIDVEPTTGLAMQANIALQLTVGTDNGAFDAVYDEVFQTPALPVLINKQHASIDPADAAMFKSQIYASEILINTVVIAIRATGIAGVSLGCLLILLACVSQRRRLRAQAANGATDDKELAGGGKGVGLEWDEESKAQAAV